MRELKLICAAASLIVIACAQAQAQDTAPQTQIVRLLARTESRARGARSNFEKLLSAYPGFLPELRAVAARLNTNPDWLLNIIASESSFIPSARNPLPGQTASGLLQIIESTAQGMGTTTAAIRQMTPIEQLRLVERYFAPFRERLNSLADVYTAAFRGFILDGGPETVVAPLNNTPKEQQAYQLNRGLDLNGDGQITKGELAAVAFSVGRFSSGVELALKPRQGANPNQPAITSAATAEQAGQTQNPPRRGGSFYIAAAVSGDGQSQPVTPQPETRSIYVAGTGKQ